MGARAADEVEVFGKSEKVQHLLRGILGLRGRENYSLPCRTQISQKLDYTGVNLIVPPAVDIVIFAEHLYCVVSLVGREAEVALPLVEE